jgi:hypothetical protein
VGFAALYPPYGYTEHDSLLEHRLEQFLRTFQPLLREDHRLHLAYGIVDHALVVQAAEHTPARRMG